jgi:hypothetical protein
MMLRFHVVVSQTLVSGNRNELAKQNEQHSELNDFNSINATRSFMLHKT